MKIKPITKWNLKPLSKSAVEFANDRKKISARINTFVKKYKQNTQYLKSPTLLKNALNNYNSIFSQLGTSGDEGYYFSLKHSQDQINTPVTARLNNIKEFKKENQNKIIFFELDIGKLNEKIQTKLLQSNKLTPYKHFLEKIFRDAKYNLSEKEEKIMNLRSTSARSNWKKMTSTILSKDQETAINEDKKKKKMTYIELLPLFASAKREVRDAAYFAINNIFERHIDMAEHEMNSILSDIKIVDQIRGVDRPDRLMHIADDLDTEIVDTMIDTIKKSFHIANDYYSLKAKLINQKSLAYHERFVPVVTKNISYTFTKATKVIDESFGTLDSEVQSIARSFIANGQIDVFPKKGKRGGAFCAHELITQPTYILLNFAGKLDDVLTFAHEVGHGIHNELMRAKQNALNFDTPLATAEVASTFFEGYVLDHITKETENDELKLSLMTKQLDDDINTIIRQVAADLFQRELHFEFRKKGYLGKEEIGKLFQKHMHHYMGDSVEMTKGSENWWIYWSHIRVPFYNYQYAFGNLIAKYFLSSIKKDKNNIFGFKEFLAAGASKSPREIFNDLGIDINDKIFWDKGIGEIERLLKETEKLARKLKKI